MARDEAIMQQAIGLGIVTPYGHPQYTSISHSPSKTQHFHAHIYSTHEQHTPAQRRRLSEQSGVNEGRDSLDPLVPVQQIQAMCPKEKAEVEEEGEGEALHHHPTPQWGRGATED